MKKILFALLLLLMPSTTILASLNNNESLGNSETSINTQVEEFFKTEKFSKLSKLFNINKENFDLNQIETIKVDETSNLNRLKVYSQHRVDYVTLMPNNSFALYEKTLIDESGNGNIEQYSEDGVLVANFDVKKNIDGKFNVKLNFINSALPPDTQLSCVSKTYTVIKKTCDNDTTCSVSCDLSPQCAMIMYGVATAHCLATGNKPAQMSTSIY